MVKPRDEALQSSGVWVPIWSWLKRGLAALPLLVFVGLFLYHFSVIRKYAVNLPHWDDWAMFGGDDHPASLDATWLYAQHNEHRTATTKTFVWLQFQLNGWNVRTHLLIDFIIYGFFLVWLVWFARKIAPHLSTQIVLAFMIFFLSPIIWLEHFSAYPIAVHFWLIFFVISAYLLFGERQKSSFLELASLSSILSIYSFASGFVTSLILLLAFWIFKAFRIRQAKEKSERSLEFQQLLVVTILIGGALAAWIISYKKPTQHPTLALPYQPAFWRVFLNLISFGFGVDRLSSKWGLLCLGIILVPIGGELWKRRGRLTNAHWVSFAIVFAILADLAAISVGRAGFGIISSKVQEYAEHGMPLIILAVVNWSLFLKDKKVLRGVTLAALWIFLCLTFQGNWSFNIYRVESAVRLEGARCVKAYYDQVGDARCPTTLPPDIGLPGFLDQAKRLNASIYQELGAESRQHPGGAPKAYDYVGLQDRADCQKIAGWAWNRAQPYKSVAVDIYDGDKLLATAPAVSMRPDVFMAGYGYGYSGFDWSIPPALKDGRTHAIRLRFAGSSIDLPNTPKPLLCTP